MAVSKSRAARCAGGDVDVRTDEIIFRIHNASPLRVRMTNLASSAIRAGLNRRIHRHAASACRIACSRLRPSGVSA